MSHIINVEGRVSHTETSIDFIQESIADIRNNVSKINERLAELEKSESFRAGSESIKGKVLNAIIILLTGAGGTLLIDKFIK